MPAIKKLPLVRKPMLEKTQTQRRAQMMQGSIFYNEHHHHYPEMPSIPVGCGPIYMSHQANLPGPRDAYYGPPSPQTLHLPPTGKPAMADAGTQTDVDKPDASAQYDGTWSGLGRLCYGMAKPVASWASGVIVFCASRINFGFAFRVPWVPFVGWGSP